MKYFIFILLIFNIGCSQKYHTQYQFVTYQPVQMYKGPEAGAIRYVDIPAHETLYMVLPGTSHTMPYAAYVHYRNYYVWAARLDGVKLVEKRKILTKKYRQTRFVFNSLDTYPIYDPDITSPIQKIASPPDSYSTPKANDSQPNSYSYPVGSTPKTGTTIYTGPRGGQYYINSNGNKTYIKR